MYIKRTIEQSILEYSEFFPVLLITGPRQVGKTTVLQKCCGNSRAYVSLDTFEHRNLAKNDPALFLQKFRWPVLIDEIQYAPELLLYIKAAADKENKPGMFWLTGSQQFHLMKNVSESLAGRAGILRLQGLSQDEQEKRNTVLPFLPAEEYISSKAAFNPQTSLIRIYERIWKGSYPRLFSANNKFWEPFYDSYMQTYIERDIKALNAVGNEINFAKFMKIAAARTAQLVNYAETASEIGVSLPTVKSWMSILEASGLVYIMRPYSNNIGKRFIKTPKAYFMDTGLACYLTGWKSPQTLESGAMGGAMLETFAVSEIIKSYWHCGKNPQIYYYRDKDKREIDILLEQDGIFYPVEIKKKSNPDSRDIKAFKALDSIGLNRGQGAVICLSEETLPINADSTIIPAGYL